MLQTVVSQLMSVAVFVLGWGGALALRGGLSGTNPHVRWARSLATGLVAGLAAWSSHSLLVLAAPNAGAISDDPLVSAAAAATAVAFLVGAFALAEWRPALWPCSAGLAGGGLAICLAMTLMALKLDGGAADLGQASSGLAAYAVLSAAGFALWQANHFSDRLVSSAVAMACALALLEVSILHAIPASGSMDLRHSDPLGHAEVASLALLTSAGALFLALAVIWAYRSGRSAALAAQQKALDGLKSGLAFFDPDGRLAGFNQAYAELFATLPVRPALGARRDALLQAGAEAGWFSMLTLEEKAQAQQLTEDPQRVQFRLPDRRWMAARTFLVADGARAVIIDDVSVEQEAMANLAAARDAAELASKAKSDFLRNMSHELNTPLNALLSAASVLAMRALSADDRALVDQVRSSGRHLADLLDDLMRLTANDDVPASLFARPIDLDALVRDAAAPFHDLAGRKSLAFDLDIGPGLGWVTSDPDLLRQTLRRLLDNAVKFTDQGQVRLHVERIADRVRFAVCDTGVGIAPSLMRGLFERFAQADTSVTRANGGVGAGLALCRQDVARLGGDLTALRPAEGGTRFEFTLALEPLAEPAPGEARALADARQRTLLVDDNPVNRQLLAMILEAAGIEWDAAENGREAVEKAAQQRYPIIFMDLQMPVMGGVEAIRNIRRAEAVEGRPRSVIFTVSADGKGRAAHDAIVAGADGHLPKPVEPSQIFHALAATAGRAAA